MVVVPLSKPAENTSQAPPARSANEFDWLRYAAAGALAAGGALLVTGYRRAGLIAAASGAALAMLDQREIVNAWWDVLPKCLEEVQTMLGHAQATVQDLSLQGERLREVLGR
jgi:hypothetical protein